VNLLLKQHTTNKKQNTVVSRLQEFQKYIKYHNRHNTMGECEKVLSTSLVSNTWNHFAFICPLFHPVSMWIYTNTTSRYIDNVVLVNLCFVTISQQLCHDNQLKNENKSALNAYFINTTYNTYTFIPRPSPRMPVIRIVHQLFSIINEICIRYHEIPWLILLLFNEQLVVYKCMWGRKIQVVLY